MIKIDGAIKYIDKASYNCDCCVYYLIKDDTIIYIGRTVFLPTRITQHFDKEYDTVLYRPVKKCHLGKIESEQINKYRPILNNKIGRNLINENDKKVQICVYLERFKIDRLGGIDAVKEKVLNMLNANS